MNDFTNSDNKNDAFDLSAQEKKISELYQTTIKQQTEEPSDRLNRDIMAMAKQQLPDNRIELDKTSDAQTQPSNQQEPNRQAKAKKNAKRAWQSPFSLVASIGILSVLVFSQRHHFNQSNDIISSDVQLVNAPVTRDLVVSSSQIPTEELISKPAFHELIEAASAKKSESLLDQDTAMIASKRLSLNQAPKVLKEKMFDRSMLKDNSAQNSPMTLFDMSKLAELLKLELAIAHKSNLEVSSLIPKMQKTLFEHLVEYKKRHAEFEVGEKFLSVLSENQRQQLVSSSSVRNP